MLGQTNIRVKPNKKKPSINYIESTGTQYINSGIYSTSNVDIEGEFMRTTSNSQIVFFGGRVSATNAFIGFNEYDLNQTRTDKGQVAYGTYYIYSNYYWNNTTDYHKAKIINKNVYVDNTLIHTFSGTFNSTVPIYIFAANQNGSVNSDGGKRCKYCKIWVSGELVRDFRPCKDEAGVYCLYDEVEKRYYYNQGTGEFLGGEAI